MISCSSATATAITANRSLTLQQTGDTHGTSILTLQNRSSINGVSIQNPNATLTLTDLILQTDLHSRTIRLEARSDRCQCSVPNFQRGRPGDASLIVGDFYTCFPKPLVVGPQTTINSTPFSLNS